MPSVLNKHKDKITCDAVYIGRGSKWGNPFKIDRQNDRATVIKKYIDYFNNSEIQYDINELRGKNLICFCAPLPCHGDFLVKQANRKFIYSKVKETHDKG